MTFQFRPAVREDIMPLIGIYGPSGCGKTFSALLMARGYVGDAGKIAMIDTESGRGSLYCDQIAGGYDTLKLKEFSPASYIEAIEAAEAEGYDIAVVDSASHEWEGIGGVCDMATINEEKAGKKSLNNWNKPKREHNKFVLKLLGSSIPLIVLMRGKYKTRQFNGKVIKDDHVSPIQAEDFIFEMTVHAEINQDHDLRLTKCSHPDLRTCFDDGKPVTIQTGEKIAKWTKEVKTLKPVIEILTDARAEAAKGKECFSVWWKNASDNDRIHANTIIGELKESTFKFDNPDHGDDPFEGDEQTGGFSNQEIMDLMTELSAIDDLSDLAEFDNKTNVRIKVTDGDLKKSFAEQYEAKLTALNEFS